MLLFKVMLHPVNHFGWKIASTARSYSGKLNALNACLILLDTKRISE